MNISLFVFAQISVVFLAMGGCRQDSSLPPISSADSLAITHDNLLHRSHTDSLYRFDSSSPFLRDTTIAFNGLRWFPVDPRFRVTSTLHRYTQAETVTVMGTRGEERRQVRYGYFRFLLPDTLGRAVTIRLNVYKFTPYDTKRYEKFRDHLSVWFTDPTTGKETYHVGRYVEVGVEQSDQSYVYTIDLNKAYNPYCAYSNLFSCAIPRKEDRLDIPLRVGEMTYHHSNSQEVLHE